MAGAGIGVAGPFPAGAADGDLGAIPVGIGGVHGAMPIQGGGGATRIIPPTIPITTLIITPIPVILFPLTTIIPTINPNRRPPANPRRTRNSSNSLITGITARTHKVTIHM